MPFDFSKLAGRITEKFGSQVALAEFIGWSPSALSNRLTNKIPFGTDEIVTLCAPDCLDIAPEEIVIYFFTKKF